MSQSKAFQLSLNRPFWKLLFQDELLIPHLSCFRLERECMQHLHESHFGPLAHPFDAHKFLDPAAQPTNSPEDDPEAVISGHVLTASMPLWQKVKEEGPVKTSPEAIRKELDTLLNSSFQLGLRNEIAPVQILQLLRMRNAEMPEKVITVQDLQRLAEELVKYLKCYGQVYLHAMCS